VAAPKTPSSSFKLNAYLAQRQAWVEGALSKLVKPARAKGLALAMNHSLMAGGKRLRPIMLMAAAEACGKPARSFIRAACAFECLHTYSLIHDDLPALDNDDLRRGKPTCHKAFGEATAILAGDALLTLAFELMAVQAGTTPVKPRDGMEASLLLARAAGWQGMVAGQMVDIDSEGRKVDAAALAYIHANKTGALLAASLECGAVLAGARSLQRRALRAYGRHAGLAFQIADDLLNVTGDARKLGKAVGSDAALQKATYPAVHGILAAKKHMDRELKAALEALKPFGNKAEPLAALARFIVERDH
jgi:geranylgeranyl diphosphate synthase type II